LTLIQQSLLRKAFARALGVIKEGISASRKGKFKEETERLDIQAEEIILPQSEDKSMSFMDFSKTFVELHEATVRIEDLGASLYMQKTICEEMVEKMKGLIVKLGKCTEMDNVRQEEKHFQHELDIFRTQIKTVNLIYTT